MARRKNLFSVQLYLLALFLVQELNAKKPPSKSRFFLSEEEMEWAARAESIKVFVGLYIFHVCADKPRQKSFQFMFQCSPFPHFGFILEFCGCLVCLIFKAYKPCN